jgi:pimeloyl-ACP methyl ester carboxylesterase
MRDPQSYAPLHLMLTAEDLATVVRFYAYNPLTAALLPLVLHEAQQGNYAPLLGQKTLLANDLGDQITSGEELSVICAEDVDLLAPRPADADTLMGNDVITRAQEGCRIWPHGTRPADFHAPWVSALPVLVLDGQLDPVTPPTYGREIVRALSHARSLLAPGQGHGVIGAGCMPRLVQRFVETLDPARLNADCLQRLGPTPAFLDYNGAGP